MERNCPLCHSQSNRFYKNEFLICENCEGIFRMKEYLPSTDKERARYEFHNYDLEDEGYKNFVSPITNSILNNYTDLENGLDFGAGKLSIISSILRKNNYRVSLYDPFYHNNKELLRLQYDYIICCEVMEHFHNPANEFELLYDLLKPNATLYCMTNIYDDSIDFGKWYYKNDITHTFFYQEKTIKWIAEHYKFNNYIIEGRLITFTK